MSKDRLAIAFIGEGCATLQFLKRGLFVDSSWADRDGAHKEARFRVFTADAVMRSSSTTVMLSPFLLPIALRMSPLTGSLWQPSPSAMKELRKETPSIFPRTLTKPRVRKNSTDFGQTT
jgi:hypothetical protein